MCLSAFGVIHVLIKFPHNRKLREMRCEKAEEEKQVDKDLDEAKLNLAHALKRKMAIKAMLSLLNVSCVALSCLTTMLFNSNVCWTKYYSKTMRGLSMQ